MQWAFTFSCFPFRGSTNPVVVLFFNELYHLFALVFMLLFYIRLEAHGSAWATAWKDTRSARDRVCD